MKKVMNMDKIIVALIQRDIRHHFGFLEESGYKIHDAQYFPEMNGSWAVDLESSGCNIEIYSDRDVLNLIFIPVNADRKYRISVEAMIYFLTEGREFVGDFEGNFAWGKRKQFERLVSLLKTYLDQIVPYFGDDFEKYKDNLMLAQKKYNDLSFKIYRTKRAK